MMDGVARAFPQHTLIQVTARLLTKAPDLFCTAQFTGSSKNTAKEVAKTLRFPGQKVHMKKTTTISRSQGCEVFSSVTLHILVKSAPESQY